MPKIKVLDSSVIDQIAAGEVVERPAHMVKELCENSLDAGANEITVDFKSGGREVLVRDNGSGVDPADLALMLARHATSKITQSDDLWRIRSYGFRGEALASIASVSEVQIISRTQKNSIGSKIECRFGQVGAVTEVGSDVGTTIIIQHLFQNVPARLKFLKSEAGESTAIKTQLKALALANPQVSFRILQNGELLYFWKNVPTHAERVQQVLEQAEMYAGEAQLEGFRVQAIVSSPNETVGHSRQIWIFVCGRYVQDRSLQTAVLDAYRNLLMHGEYPTVVIYLDCDPEDVDVNVSPNKSQVKFRDSGVAFRVVQRAVRGILERAPWVKDILSTPTASTTQAAFLTEPEENQTLSFQGGELERVQFRSKEFVSQLETVSSDKWESLQVLGQAHLTYIVAQKSDAIIFIDQHAAHERVLFEKLMAGYGGGHLEVQSFLLPPVVKLTEDAVAEIVKNQVELEKLGLHLDQLGPEELAIRAAPAIVKSEALTPMIEKLGQEYVESHGSFHMEKIIAHLVATMACHTAVRAGQALSESEMHSLLAQMDEFPLSSFCPHGRPVYVEYPIRKLERDFGRIV